MPRFAGVMLLLVGFVALLATPARAQDVLPVPPLSARVIDQTGTLAADRLASLQTRLANFEAQAGTQIVVLIVATTQPEDIAAYAQRVADTWKIGRRGVGDGLLLVVARNDKRVRIEVAKALEGAVPDLAARQIIDRAIRPAFQAGDFAGGIDAAVAQLQSRIRNEGLAAPAQPPATGAAGGTDLDWEHLAIFLFVAVPLVGGVFKSVLGRGVGSLATSAAAGAFAWWLTASLLLAGIAGVIALVVVGLSGAGGRVRGTRGGGPPIIFGGGGGSGDGFSSGGGGFSSGGGGDFGGGGASGGW